ncbi:hypothetical protein C5745_09775 [Sphingobacterium haloxyli]|uniref:NUDIX hydrolase n=2 Tax=Sphingobacterium haloxyli TaxID=2100533 RepID=A0A2S9J4A6_9SPHI|nr:hypothetical protein C5745_09775 [Sphingobacterium haloxyli]
MLHVTCVIIEHDNKFLICQRSASMKLPLKWEFPLRLYPFLCKWTGGLLAIAEHAQAIWVDKSELQGYDWAEADLPIVRELLDIR